MGNTPEYLKEMDDKVREIGKHLGMEFDHEYADKQERNWNYWSQLKNGNKVISFHTGGYKFIDRWRISVSFPRDARGQAQTGYNVKCPEINISMGKSSEKVAKDIKSRLLPEYEKQLADVLVRNESSNRYAEGRMRQICEIADFLGQKRPEDDNRLALYPMLGKGVYKIEPYSQEHVKFDVECPADKAIEILKILGYGV